MKIGRRVHTLADGGKRIVANLPLVGPLAYCSWEQHRICIREMFFILLFSTATFWMKAVFLLGSHNTRALGYPALVLSTIKTGELFIFTVGFLGPILMHVADDPKDARAFPGRLWNIAALVIIGLIAAGFHSQIKAAQFKGSVDPTDADFFYTVSLYVATAAIVLRYLSMVYRRSTFIPQIEIKRPVDEFASKFDARHTADKPPHQREDFADEFEKRKREEVGELPREDFADAFEQLEAEKRK